MASAGSTAAFAPSSPFELDDEHSLESLREVRRVCGESGNYFEDSEFPVLVSHDPSTSEYWVRPEQLQFDGEAHIKGTELNLRKSWSVIDGSPCAQDVVRGRLGYSWFTSTMAALSAFADGEIIRRLFVDLEQKAYGAHGIRLYRDGAWRTMIVDERFARAGDGRQNAIQFKYSMCRRRQLWLPLLEKGIAKMRGSYAALGSNASVGIAMQAATGCRCVDRPLGEDAWKTLVDALDAGFLLCLATRRTDAVKNAGLASNGHAYAVLSVLEMPPAAASSSSSSPLRRGEMVKLIRLANPYDTRRAATTTQKIQRRHSKLETSPEWNGAWRETSPLWTPKLAALRDQHEVASMARKTNRISKDTHSIYCSVEEIKEFFEYASICEYRDSWTETRCSLTSSRDVFVVGVPSSPDGRKATDAIIELVVKKQKTVHDPLALAVFPLQDDDLGYSESFLQQLASGNREEKNDEDAVAAAAAEDAAARRGTARRQHYITGDEPPLATSAASLDGSAACCRCSLLAPSSSSSSAKQIKEYVVVPVGIVPDEGLSLVVRSAQFVTVECHQNVSSTSRRLAAHGYVRANAVSRVVQDFAHFHTRNDGGVYYLVADNLHHQKWLKVDLTFTELVGYALSRQARKKGNTFALVSHVPPRSSVLVVSTAPDAPQFKYQVGKRVTFVTTPPPTDTLFDPPLPNGPGDLHQPEPLPAKVERRLSLSF